MGRVVNISVKNIIGTIWFYSNNFVNKNRGFTRLSITTKTTLTDSIFISADYGIIWEWDWESIVTPDDGIICRNIYHIISQ
jgi:hypothetical protein